MTQSFDIILWGATGFTGQLVADYLAQNAPANLRWAIAGRNQQKLEKVRQHLATLNPALADLPIRLGDSRDRASLDKLVSETRVICSTVGPFTLYGSPLVEACVEQGIAYCDSTGEPTWVREMIDKFHQPAQQSGARIVHCCGVDSIPSDLGTLLVQEYAQETHGRFCHSINHYIVVFKGGFSGGTFNTLINTAASARDDKLQRRLLADPYSLVPDHKHDWSEKDQMTAVFDTDIGRWTGPFVMASINTRIVRRSHALQDWRYGDDFTFREVTRFGRGLSGRLTATGMSAGLGLFVVAAAVGPLRKLLTTFLPDSGEGPDKEARENGYFVTQMLGKVRPADGQPEQWIKGKVVGQNDPGYGETAKMLGESALCLALDDLPQQGGILTPATAMGMTLVERLRAAGMTFEAGEWG